MSVKLSKRNLLFGLYAVGALLLLTASALSWNQYYTDPARTFWATVEQGMKTSGVTVQSSQTATGSSVNQTIQYSMGGQSVTHALTNLTQGGTTIVDEMIGTPTADYTRYTSIKTDQKTASGKTMDFSKVLGVWAKTAGEGQLLPQAILGTNLPLGGVAIPLASLSPADRTKLLHQIQHDNVYAVSFKNKDVTKTHSNGRLLYTYSASIKPDKYAAMMKAFGTAGGLHSFDTLNPTQYAGQPAFTLRMTIDVRARQLVDVQSDDGSVKQTYTGYDIPVVIAEPAKAITSTELQKRLQQMQQ